MLLEICTFKKVQKTLSGKGEIASEPPLSCLNVSRQDLFQRYAISCACMLSTKTGQVVRFLGLKVGWQTNKVRNHIFR